MLIVKVMIQIKYMNEPRRIHFSDKLNIFMLLSADETLVQYQRVSLEIRLIVHYFCTEILIPSFTLKTLANFLEDNQFYLKSLQTLNNNTF